MVKTQAPGYYRVMVGDFEMTAISDGTVKLPMLKLLTNAKPEKLAAALKAGFLKETVETSVNTYLVNTGSKLVLIDTGAAGLFGPALGNLLTNLKAAGYQPEQVDEIYMTHMHPDHVGGLMAGTALALPNAVLRIDKADTDFWLKVENMNAAPEGAKGFFQGAMASVNPYVAAGKLKTFQFENPSVTIPFDTDSKAAAAQRKVAYAAAAKSGNLVSLTHVAFPGLGHLRVAPGGKGYVWVPLNYSSLK